MPDRGDAKPSYEDSSQITGRFAKGLLALLERFLHPNVPDARTDQMSPIVFFLAGHDRIQDLPLRWPRNSRSTRSREFRVASPTERGCQKF